MLLLPAYFKAGVIWILSTQKDRNSATIACLSDLHHVGKAGNYLIVWEIWDLRLQLL